MSPIVFRTYCAGQPLKAAFRIYLELVFCISVVNSDTAQKGTFTEYVVECVF